MEAFLQWALERGITVKNKHAKKSGLAVWEALQKELREQKNKYDQLVGEFQAIGALLKAMKSDLNSLKTSDNNKA